MLKGSTFFCSITTEDLSLSITLSIKDPMNLTFEKTSVSFWKVSGKVGS